MIGCSLFLFWSVLNELGTSMHTDGKPLLFIRKTPSMDELVSYGIKTLAYIKPIVVGGQVYHSIHAADGTPLTVMEERDDAYALVRQNEMEPISVH